MKQAIKILAIIVVALMVIGYVASKINPPNVSAATTENDSTKAPASSEMSPEEKALVNEKASNWDYSEDKDKMTDKSRYFARCDATNEFHFNFPYDGGSTLSILVRKMDGENEVMLEIDKGQFNSADYSSVSMKFDDGKIHQYEFSEAADGSSNYIFLEGSSSIIARLKKAEKVKIEAPFFQEGRQVAEFNVEGLEWNH